MNPSLSSITPLYLCHSALLVWRGANRYAIEVAPVWSLRERDGRRRAVSID